MGRPLLVNLTFSRPWDNMGNLGVLSGLCVDLHPYCTLGVAGIYFDPTSKLLVCAFSSPLLHVRVYFEQLGEAFWRKVRRKTKSSCDCEGCISDYRPLEAFKPPGNVLIFN